MVSTYEMLKERREEILALAARHGATNMRVFGSVARGEDNKDSDIDFLIKMENGRSLFDMAKLQRDLEKLLLKKVDIVSERGIYHRLRENILHAAREI
jgi:predicted nucleotidyltransferase